MTHDQEMAIMRAETARLVKENRLIQQKIENQLNEINQSIKEINDSLR